MTGKTIGFAGLMYTLAIKLTMRVFMLLQNYVQQQADQFWFSRQQASQFAKVVATDFNPIHDEDSKRFCVPGDLLFAYLLHKNGLSKQLNITFNGMVGADVPLHCVAEAGVVQILDQQDKSYLTLTQSGEVMQNCQFIGALTKDYVRFSGQNFPHILQPLMEQHQVMIHPQRPLVIYQSMALQFFRFTDCCPSLQLTASSLQVDGKRGNVVLEFALKVADEVIGTGEKRMILSNLVPYDASQMQALVDLYNHRKATMGAAA